MKKTYALTTAKDIYCYGREFGHMQGLEALGFSFEDCGDGHAMISGEPRIDSGDLELFQGWVEILVGNGSVRIMDWMSTAQLVGE